MHRMLKAALAMEDDLRADLARNLKKSPSYVTSRITGKKPWSLEDVYIICDKYSIPHTEISKYFPRGGKDTPIR